MIRVEDGLVELSTANRQCTFLIRAVPLPDAVTRLLDDNTSLLGLIEQAQGRDERKGNVSFNDQTIEQIRQLKEKLNDAFVQANGGLWNSNTIDEILSFGPQKCGPNLLINRIPNSAYKQRGASIWTTALNNQTKTNVETTMNKDDYDLSMINGFQMATAKGSLCEEPMIGVAFIIERWVMNTIVNHEIDEEVANPTDETAATAATGNPVEEVESLVETMSITSEESSTLNSQEKPRRVIDKSKIVINRGPLSGQIAATIRDGCRKAFDSQPRRLVAAMFKCEIMVNAEALGNASFSRRSPLSPLNIRSVRRSCLRCAEQTQRTGVERRYERRNEYLHHHGRIAGGGKFWFCR